LNNKKKVKFNEKVWTIFQLSIISIYLINYHYNSKILIFNIILGITCVLFLPGYNILSLLKPKEDIIYKIGITFIISLAFENILMISFYLIDYDKYALPIEGDFISFQINPNLLVYSIQAFNLVFLILNYLFINRDINFKNNHNECLFRNFKKFRNNFNIKYILIFICYLISIILVGFSVLNSNNSVNSYNTNRRDYRSNLMFFLRVSPFFYIYISFAIFFLIILILNNSNKFLILLSISIFLYTLWILPYLQIKNYFNHDSYFLYSLYINYKLTGINGGEDYGFCLIQSIGSLRYSTNLFNAILITSTMNMDINYTIWFLFPIFFTGLPFFFYSIFEKYEKIETQKGKKLILLTVLAISIPQFLKGGHNANTGFLAIFTFFILTLNFHEILRKNKFKREIILILILYFFLCLTHFEECIYFLVLVALFNFIYLFIEQKKNMKITLNSNQIAYIKLKNHKKGLKKFNSENKIKKKFFILNGLLAILILMFYWSLLFFGYINHYYTKVFGGFEFIKLLLIFHNIKLSILFYLIFFLANFVYLSYIIIFKKFINVLSLIIKTANIVKGILNRFNNFFYGRFFKIVFFPIFYFILLILNLNILFSYNNEPIVISLISLILSYIPFCYNLFLFLRKIKYIKLNNNKQMFFLTSIISSSLIIILFSLLFILGLLFQKLILNFLWMGFYVSQYSFSSSFIFFNLLIIQDNFFKNHPKKHFNGTYKFLVVSFLVLSVFFSLRTLRFG